MAWVHKHYGEKENQARRRNAQNHRLARAARGKVEASPNGWSGSSRASSPQAIMRLLDEPPVAEIQITKVERHRGG